MSVSILASGRGDRLWWRISQSKKVCFQLFPETRNAFYGSDGLRNEWEMSYECVVSVIFNVTFSTVQVISRW